MSGVRDFWRLVGRLVLATIVLAGAPATGQAPDGEGERADRVLIVGSGPVTGSYHGAASALARAATLDRDQTGLRLVVESTNGNQENIRRLRAGDLDFAVAGSDLVFAAITGLGEFEEEGRFTSLRTVLTLVPEPLAILVRADSEAATVADLAGARVALGPLRSRSRAMFEQVLTAHGVDPGALAGPRSLAYARQADALCGQEVDAVAVLATHPSGTIAALASACAVRVLELDAQAAEDLLRGSPHLASARIPTGLYAGFDQPVVMVGPVLTLVTSTATPADTVETVARSILAHLDELAAQYPALAGLGRERLLTGRVAAPHHDGLAALLP